MFVRIGDMMINLDRIDYTEWHGDGLGGRLLTVSINGHTTGLPAGQGATLIRAIEDATRTRERIEEGAILSAQRIIYQETH